jgi:hypothetical protein
MRIANRVAFKPARLLAGAASAASLAFAWMLTVSALTAPAFAQSARTGVSIPDNSVLTTDSDAPAAPAKPSAAAPAATKPSAYGPYVPYTGPKTAGTNTASSSNTAAFDPDANIVTEATAGSAQRRPLNDTSSNPDAGIVTYVPSVAGEVPDGTLVKASLREELSTLTTKPGARFTAAISEPVMRDGRVVIPVGAVLEGRVTWVHGGKRIGGSAAIHIEPYTVTLPDSSEYLLRARVIDTNSWDNTKVDDEGTIMRSESKKRNATVMGLTTGSGMAAGAMIGGVPGALIGAGVGAGISTVVWLQQDRQAILPEGLGLVFSLTEPMRVTPASAEATPAKTAAVPGA